MENDESRAVQVLEGVSAMGAIGDAEYYQSHKDDDGEWGEGSREPSRTDRLSVVVSVRLTPDQEQLLREMADRRGMSLSAYLRDSA